MLGFAIRAGYSESVGINLGAQIGPIYAGQGAALDQTGPFAYEPRSFSAKSRGNP